MTATAEDEYYMSKQRGEPVGNVKSGYKDLLFIAAAEEAFEEAYIRIVKKGTTKEGQFKSAQKISDIYILLTKFVNKTSTTTPLNPAQKCLAGKNFTKNVESNIKKIIEVKSGIRDTKSNSEIAFYRKFKTMCIDDIHHDAWNSFYDKIESIMGDDPATTSAFKATSSVNDSSATYDIAPEIRIKLPIKRPSSSIVQSVSDKVNLDDLRLLLFQYANCGASLTNLTK